MYLFNIIINTSILVKYLPSIWLRSQAIIEKLMIFTRPNIMF